MTDRELLELAAKAAGYTSHGYGEMACGSPCLLLKEADFTGLWAPLTDDGEALRLAVRLRIEVDYYLADVQAKHDDFDPVFELFSEHADPYAATRRAIVRAAAAIGRGEDE